MFQFLGPVVGMVSGALERRHERKQSEAKATHAWEAATGRSMENGWKDEYVTVVITFPLWQIFIGNLVAAFAPEKGKAILAANSSSLDQIGALMNTPYGDVMMVVVLAAVGIKGLKALK